MNEKSILALSALPVFELQVNSNIGIFAVPKILGEWWSGVGEVMLSRKNKNLNSNKLIDSFIFIGKNILNYDNFNRVINLKILKYTLAWGSFCKMATKAACPAVPAPMMTYLYFTILSSSSSSACLFSFHDHSLYNNIEKCNICDTLLSRCFRNTLFIFSMSS